ncbi:hypothetical protein SDC9_133692 [bioreactor metagenome]|uniref:Uncharacterized protein n=1 Tax=bioreactor metagenome TaxID=1076179 RepID=A0A645DDF9_9ZZZZ
MPYSSSPRRKVRYSRAPVATPSAVLLMMFMSALSALFGSAASVAGTAHQSARIQNQRHGSVAQNGGTRYIGHLAVIAFQVLHHHLMLAQQLVDQQRHAAAFGLDHHHDVAGLAFIGARHLESTLQRDHRHVFVAHLDQLRAVGHGVDIVGLDLEGLDHRGQRQDIDLFAHTDGHAVHDGQRQRQAHRHLHAHAGDGLDLDRAAQRGDVSLDHVHAHAAARDIGDHIGRRKARRKDQLPDIAVGHAVGDIHAALAGLVQNPLAIHALAVVAHLDDDGASLVGCCQRQRAML